MESISKEGSVFIIEGQVAGMLKPAGGPLEPDEAYSVAEHMD